MKQHGNTMEEPLTIQDVARVTGRSTTSVYRYVKKGKLKHTTLKQHGKTIYQIKKSDLERFLGYPVDTMKQHGTTMEEQDNNGGITMKQHGTTMKQQETALTIENLHKSIQDVISQQHSQLMKPMEEQALFIAGTLTKENQFLKQRLETVIAENDELRNAMKALPGPVEEVVTQLEEKEAALERQKELEQDLQEKVETLTRMKTEREQLHAEKRKAFSELQKLQKETSEYKKAMAKYDELEEQLKNKDEKLLALEQEKAQIAEKLEAEVDELRETIGGKDQRIKDLEADVEEECSQKVILHKSLVKTEEQNKELQEKIEAEVKKKEEKLKEFEDKLKEIEEKKEKEQEEIAAAWAKRLEEEERKPWWKKIFS